jgi:hypothetical protein
MSDQHVVEKGHAVVETGHALSQQNTPTCIVSTGDE